MRTSWPVWFVMVILYAGPLVVPRQANRPNGKKRNRYPGCPEGVNPKVGKYWGDRLDVALAWVRSTDWGSKLSNVDVCRTLNSGLFRDLFDLHEYRYVSESNVCNAVVRARKDGSIRLVKSAVQYRQGHMWKTEHPAVYATSLKLLPSQAAQVEACIKDAITAKVEELRKGMEDRSEAA